MSQVLRRALMTAFIGTVAGGCSAEAFSNGEQPAESDVGEVRSRAAMYDFDAWTSWTMPVNVCFNPYSDPAHPGQIPDAATYSGLKSVAFGALQESWAKVPSVVFADAGDCGPSTPANPLHIVLEYGPGFGGNCGVGVNATCVVGGGLADQATITTFTRVVVHEVGHALGFAHEHQRDDIGSPTCVSATSSACLSCKASVDSHDPCSANDWNTCINPSPPVSAPQTFDANSDQYGQVLNNIGNVSPVDSLELLTVYDPQSIMNYCNTGATDVPTALDLLGLEMLYPVSAVYPLGCVKNCFYGGGSKLFARSDDSLTTTWRARGALNVLLTSPVDGQQVTTVPMSQLPTGTSTQSFTFRNPKTQTLTATGTLVDSTSTHTAIMTSIQGALI